jgi:hypothetical protein
MIPDTWNGKAHIHTWTYLDADGAVLGIVARYDDTNGAGKDIVPFFKRNGSGFDAGIDAAIKDKRPLFGLDILAAKSNKAVFIVEGEKCAEALHHLEFVAVTSLSGSNAVDKADWTPLKGRKHIHLLPDNDGPGQKYMASVAGILRGLDPGVDIRVVELPGLPDKGDVIDWMRRWCPGNGWDGYSTPANATELRDKFEKAVRTFAGRMPGAPAPTPVARAVGGGNVVLMPKRDERAGEDEGPLPLTRELPAPNSFPLDALGSVLGGAARIIREVVQAPAAICGQGVLAGAALAVQPHANFELDGRNRPISLYFCTVGDTGERKSEVDNIVLGPHRKREKALQDAFAVEKAEFDIDFEVWDRTKADVLRKAKNKLDRQVELENLGPPPPAPLDAILLMSEPTYEGIYKLLANGLPSVGLFSDEGGRFLGGHAMNADNALKTAAGLSGLWDNGCADRVRAGDGSSKLYGRRISLHLMIQGVVAEGLVVDRLLREQGLLSRVLMTWPETTVGSRPYKSMNVYESPEVKRYFACMLNALETSMPLADGKRNELAPRALTLTPDAKALWVKFHNFCDVGAGAGGKLETIRGLANKAPEHALRMAGVLTLVDALGAGAIDIWHVEAGIHLADFYLSEALRFTEAGMCDPDIVLAEKVAKWASGRDYVYPVLIYQLGPNGVRTAKDVRRIARILEDHRHWMPVDGGMVLDGKHRREAWKVAP